MPPAPRDSADDKSQTWLSLLQRVGEAVAPAILTAGGFVGFVAFAGSVIIWTRFSAAQVPPDQVVAAYPRTELVAVASALLLIFGFVGLLAVVAFFLINRKGGPSIGVCRGLLGLLAVEGLAAIALVDSPWGQDKVLASELFLLPLIVAFWATFAYERPTLSGHSGDGDEKNSGLADRVGDVVQDLLRSEFVNRTILGAGAVSLLAAAAVAVGLPAKQVAIVALAVIGIVPSAWLVLILVDNDNPRTDDLEPGKVPFTRRGQTLILVLLPVAAIGPSLALENEWLPFSLAAAVGLIAGLWRVAVLTDHKFMWYGLAVFISVPLFGTLTGVARNVADPQVQPLALIRKDDGPDEAIQGLYVTETDDRVYFATVATEGCTDQLVPHSGRLLWVPRSEVVAMSVGPPQAIDDAAKTALEMSYSLTPAVETPAGDHVSLTVAEKRGESESVQEGPQERRLENVGPAVQPNFGRGLRLTPENASPGEVVTLKMTAPNPNENVEGFGSSRQGRTLRLGGVPVDVVKEEARSPFEAEYVESSTGQTLNLKKNSLYVLDGDDYVEVDEGSEVGDQTLFVKLHDDSVVEVGGSGVTEDGYLRLATEVDEPPRIAVAGRRLPAAVLEDGTSLTLETHLLRQAWRQDRIRFRIPDHAATGPITVECDQLAGQPLLRVARPPEAKISVRIEPESRRVVFDSSRSADNGRIAARHWRVEGVDRGKQVRISETLPPRIQSYSIRLTVIDDEGQTDRAELRLLRLPAHFLAFEKRRSKHPRILEQARAELQKATAVAPAAAIELNMQPGELPEPPNPEETIRHAERVRSVLLRSEAPAPADPYGLPVKTLAFGSHCPAERKSRIGRLDVLVLGEGVRAVPSRKCPVVRMRAARWLRSPP